jgi:hypothetical protein
VETRTIPVEEDVYRLLQKWADKRQVSLNEIVRESIVEYARRLEEDEQFEAEIDEIMQEQAWLLNQLKDR